MNYNEILLHCRFLDENGQPKGREYTYVYKFTKETTHENDTDYILVAIPSHVMAEIDGKKLLVTGVFADPAPVMPYADKLKYVVPYVESEQ